jgi:hypothetical protein
MTFPFNDGASGFLVGNQNLRRAFRGLSARPFQGLIQFDGGSEFAATSPGQSGDPSRHPATPMNFISQPVALFSVDLCWPDS